ncbi:sugar transferase [Ferrimonas balearica]|nr:sugar transferase [Ferrimonas balearica]
MRDFFYNRDAKVTFFPAMSAEMGRSRLSPRGFRICKRFIDLLVPILLLPFVLGAAGILLFVNWRYNPGRLFYTQTRMGLNCRPFTVYKFRSMIDVAEVKRSANCPLEVDRITPLGHFMRKTRVDELPQLINVLKGEMSLIGPRPDFYEHAIYFSKTVKGYKERHAVRPGISGLAQVRLGYIEGEEATRAKVRADLFYIRNRSLRLEAFIFLRTLAVVLRMGGA